MSAITDIPSRRMPGRSFRGRLRDTSNHHRSTSVVVGMALVTALLPLIVLLPPFNALLPTQASWVDGFALAGVYVLLALGLDADQARASLRLGLSRFPTAAEIDAAAERIAAGVARLRALS